MVYSASRRQILSAKLAEVTRLQSCVNSEVPWYEAACEQMRWGV